MGAERAVGTGIRLHYQGGVALLAAADSAGAEAAFRRALEEAVRDPELLPWVYLNLAPRAPRRSPGPAPPA